ncbi:MAG: type II toxin-antitoxin system Phd/YefM family antitoxin [Gammaproteobacteria bacterium]|nr:MAG: type II toxin-antitoxin system Phd/YefM family antitoxin [Gammaproteobacteria bacterium]
MKVLNASDAKREFGELLLRAQQEPVAIKRNGKPVAVVISTREYETLEALKQRYLKQALAEGDSDLLQGYIMDGPQVMDRLRRRLAGEED